MKDQPELVRTQDTFWVTINEVDSLIFVFHVSEIGCGNIHIYGMKNCFVVRFYLQGTSVLKEIPSEEHSLPMNFPGEVFLLLIIIQQALLKILCQKRETQGTSGSHAVYLPGTSTWE